MGWGRTPVIVAICSAPAVLSVPPASRPPRGRSVYMAGAEGLSPVHRAAQTSRQKLVTPIGRCRDRRAAWTDHLSLTAPRRRGIDFMGGRGAVRRIFPVCLPPIFAPFAEDGDFCIRWCRYPNRQAACFLSSFVFSAVDIHHIEMQIGAERLVQHRFQWPGAREV